VQRGLNALRFLGTVGGDRGKKESKPIEKQMAAIIDKRREIYPIEKQITVIIDRRERPTL
jgi:hypothetical protein